MEKKKKPEITVWQIIVSTIRIFVTKYCPACRGIEPYYRDCEICEGYVIGCDLAPKLETLIKYLAWLKT